MIPRFVDQQENKDVVTKYDAGRVCVTNNEFMIGYEMEGAKETFSVGQPVFDKDSNLMGYLGIGLYSNLDYSNLDYSNMINTRIPVEYWKICLPTSYCIVGKQVYTYWQNKGKDGEQT